MQVCLKKERNLTNLHCFLLFSNLLCFFQLKKTLIKVTIFFAILLKLHPDPNLKNSWIRIHSEKNCWIRICKQWMRIHSPGLRRQVGILCRARVPPREPQLFQGHLHVLPHRHLRQDTRQDRADVKNSILHFLPKSSLVVLRPSNGFCSHYLWLREKYTYLS